MAALSCSRWATLLTCSAKIFVQPAAARSLRWASNPAVCSNVLVPRSPLAPCHPCVFKS